MVDLGFRSLFAFAIGELGSRRVVHVGVTRQPWACVDSVDTWILGMKVLGKESTMARTHPPYRPAFRAEAVELARTSGKGIPQLASDLGVSEQALRGWIKRADTGLGHGPPGDLASAEREELRRLRREVKVLQQERDISRKYLGSCRHSMIHECHARQFALR